MKQTLFLIGKRIKEDIKANGAGLAAVAACFVLFAFFFGDVCPTQILFGLPCPACGLTRAGVYLLLGQHGLAWRMHPFIYGWVFMLLCIFFQRYVRGKKLGRAFYIMFGVLIAAMVIFYIYRMCVYFPNVSPMTLGNDGIFSEYIKPFMPEPDSNLPPSYFDMVK